MLLRYLFALFLPLAIVNQSYGEDLKLKEFYKMSPNIQTIKQMCPWRSTNAQGTIRLMQVEDKGAHRLYVQWLRQGIAGTETMPISTIGIEEINDDHYYRFDLPEGRLMAGACSVETIMEDILDERRFRLTLYLLGPGKYEYNIARLLDGGS
ncbi:MAG: hypothetical protein HRU08_10380 [Oleispira sp.]|jgi:hypothetical protein|nr:hypothetical protein [Oleispira sp.]